MRNLGARVIAVEPQPDCIKFLRCKFGRDPYTTLIPVAVGSKAGNHALHLSRRTPTVSSLSSEWIESVTTIESFRSVQWEDQLFVPVTTLDELIKKYGMPDFTKIDVEGYEGEVFRGLSRPLPLISFEYIPVAAHIAIGCIERLRTLGNYEYNWTIKERSRFHSNIWVSDEKMIEILSTFPREAEPGDIYCRYLAHKDIDFEN
jgi:FkbM family methyltransferase